MNYTFYFDNILMYWPHPICTSNGLYVQLHFLNFSQRANWLIQMCLTSVVTQQ